MALVVFLRGVNVGGHRTFRPSVLARQLSRYDVVNIGAAGTFVVKKPGPRAQFLVALRKQLPFETQIMVAEGRDLVRMETEDPFDGAAAGEGIVRFVSVLARAGSLRKALPVSFPPEGQWLVKVVAAQGPYVFGMYRRHMKTIGYLNKVDDLFSAPATSRSWSTIAKIVRILKGGV